MVLLPSFPVTAMAKSLSPPLPILTLYRPHWQSSANDGNRVIGGASDRNYARVYNWDGTSWSLEATFTGGSSDCFGESVDIDADGDTVIVSGTGCHNESDRGYVKIYRKSGSTWSQIGNTIEGEYGTELYKADEFGHEVSISDDGNIVAVSSLKNPGALDISQQYKSAGHVRVYEFENGDWNQIENDLDGEVKDARFGDIIVLSSDGKKLVVQQDEDEKVFTYTRD
jgi:WD40 repeat protein